MLSTTCRKNASHSPKLGATSANSGNDRIAHEKRQEQVVARRNLALKTKCTRLRVRKRPDFYHAPSRPPTGSCSTRRPRDRNPARFPASVCWRSCARSASIAPSMRCVAVRRNSAVARRQRRRRREPWRESVESVERARSRLHLGAVETLQMVSKTVRTAWLAGSLQ